MSEIHESEEEEESSKGDLCGGDGRDKVDDMLSSLLGLRGLVSSSEVVRSMSRVGVEDVGEEVDADIIVEMLNFWYFSVFVIFLIFLFAFFGGGIF